MHRFVVDVVCSADPGVVALMGRLQSRVVYICQVSHMSSPGCLQQGWMLNSDPL